MTLDPQVARIIEKVAAQDLKPLHVLSPEVAREQMRLLAIGGRRDEVAAVEEIVVDTVDARLPARVYRPLRCESTPPVVVYYHGGGWVIGDLDTHDGLCRALANASGCVFVSVDYRLAPEHRYPAAAEDAYGAAQWVAEESDRLGVDRDRLAVAGDSAGGNLAAVAALMARDRGGPSIAFQVLVYPITDGDVERASYLENAEGYVLTKSAMEWFWNHYLASEAERFEPHASPLRAESLRGLPPALVTVAEYDPLRDEGLAYAAAMEEASVSVELIRYDGMVHGFLRQLDVFDRARVGVEDIASALRRVFAVA